MSVARSALYGGAWLVVVALALGCSRDAVDGKQAVEAGLARALPDHMLGPGAGLRAEPLPLDPLHRDALRAWRAALPGPISVVATTRVVLRTRAGASASVNERAEVQVSTSGDFRGSIERDVQGLDGTRDELRESAVYIGGRFYVAGPSGVFFARNPMTEDHMAWRSRGTAVLPELMQILGPLVRRTPAGTDPQAPDSQRFSLSLGETVVVRTAPEARNSSETWPSWWRGEHRVTSLRGEVRVDNRCGCPVEASVELRATLMRDETPADLEVEHRLVLGPLPGEPAIDVPSEPREPRRRRVIRMIQEVLGEAPEP